MRLINLFAFLLATSGYGESSNAVWTEQAPLIASGEGTSDRALATSCYTNITEIYVTEGNVLDASVPRTYTLCANTVFTIGFYSQNTGAFLQGDNPITPRANAHYKCGTSGSSSNNCILTTGTVGLLLGGPGYSEPVTNFTVQGLTFASLDTFGIALQGAGQIAFKDCIFRDLSNVGPVQLDLSSRRRLKQLPTLKNPPSTGRKLATGVNFTYDLEVSFDGCVFKDNSALSDGGGSPGLITGISTPDRHIYLSVSNSLFVNNTFNSELQGNGYAIQVDDAVTLTSNCFINNNFINFGPVQVIYNATLNSSDNFGVSNGDVKCPYAALSDTTDDSFTQVVCVPYEATSCSFSNPAIPPIAPVAPVSSPSSAVPVSIAPSKAPVSTTTTPVTPSTSAPVTPTSAPVSKPTVAEPSSKPEAQPTVKTPTSDAGTFREASNVVAVGGIILWCLLF